jgi:hypothetical protein
MHLVGLLQKYIDMCVCVHTSMHRLYFTSFPGLTPLISYDMKHNLVVTVHCHQAYSGK